MCKRMGHSIQEYCKKINRELTIIESISPWITFFAIVTVCVFLSIERKESLKPVLYTKGNEKTSVETSQNEAMKWRPFASKNGTTYTFSWCQGSGRIADKNKIVFSSKEEAEKSGRVLSKFCKK